MYGYSALLLYSLRWRHVGFNTYHLFRSLFVLTHKYQSSALVVLYAVTRDRFLSLGRNKHKLCPANHRAGYFSNLTCDWLSIVWAHSEQETENGPSAIPTPGDSSAETGPAMMSLCIILQIDVVAKRTPQPIQIGVRFACICTIFLLPLLPAKCTISNQKLGTACIISS